MFKSKSQVTLLCKSDYETLSRMNYRWNSKDSLSECGMAKLTAAKIIDDHLCPDDLVRVGTTISLKDLGTGSVAQAILTDGKIRAASGGKETAKVPIRSSLGMAILGMRRGEDIKWTLPGGHVRYLRIAELVNQRSKI